MRFEQNPGDGDYASRDGAAKLAKQPRLRELPIPHDGLGRHLEHGSGLLDAETAEETQLNNLVLPLVEFLQCFERIVEGDEIQARFVPRRPGRR